jgi:hypothetical protein
MPLFISSTFGFPLSYPRFKGFTSSGALASGYKVETYIAGTTTPLATYPTYTDALAGTNPNANPVVLNAQGEATIFGQGGQAYKLVYTDSTNVVIWTVDAIVLTDVPKSFTTLIKSGNQTGMAAATKITTWSVEVDALNEWSAVNNRWTATYAGKYVVFYYPGMSDSVGATTLLGYIYKNGGVVASGTERAPAAGVGMTVPVMYMWIASAGDILEFYSQGSANTTVNSGVASRIMIYGIA